MLLLYRLLRRFLRRILLLSLPLLTIIHLLRQTVLQTVIQLRITILPLQAIYYLFYFVVSLTLVHRVAHFESRSLLVIDHLMIGGHDAGVHHLASAVPVI